MGRSMKRWDGSAWIDVAKVARLDITNQDPGQYISDGVWLTVDPNRDTVAVDAEGVITQYKLKDRPRTAPFLANLGSTAIFKTMGTTGWSVTGDNAIAVVATNDSRRVWATKERGAIPDDIDITAETMVASGSILCGTLFCFDQTVPDVYFKSYFGGIDNSGVILRAYKGTLASVSWTAAKSISLNTWYKIRTKKTGATLQVKVWRSVDSEPTAWDITQTDTTYSGGGIAMYSFYTGTTYFKNLTFQGWDGYSVSDGGKLVQDIENRRLKRIQGLFRLRMWPFLNALSNPYTIFVVAKHPFTSGVTFQILNILGSPLCCGFYSASGKREIGPFSNTLGVNINIPYVPVASGLDAFVHCAVIDTAAASKLKATHQGAKCINASTVNSPGWSPNNYDLLSIGADSELLEIVVYNRALTDAEVDLMTKYLMTKWGILTRMFGYTF